MRFVARLGLYIVQVLHTCVEDDYIEAVESGSPPAKLVDAGKGLVVKGPNLHFDPRTLRQNLLLRFLALGDGADGEDQACQPMRRELFCCLEAEADIGTRHDSRLPV